MNYKQVLVHEDPIYTDNKKKEYMSWDDVNAHFNVNSNVKININTNMSSKGIEKGKCNLNKYEVLCENDSILYDITHELKDKFEFKGFLNNSSVSKLIDIFAKHMNLEEIFVDEDDEDNVLDEDDNNF